MSGCNDDCDFNCQNDCGKWWDPCYIISYEKDGKYANVRLATEEDPLPAPLLVSKYLRRIRKGGNEEEDEGGRRPKRSRRA